MPCVSLEIHESKEYPGAYSVKINGQEVSKTELEYKRVGEVEHITASGTPKEMAALVLELQGRRKASRKAIRETIDDILAEQLKVEPIRRKAAPDSDAQQPHLSADS